MSLLSTLRSSVSGVPIEFKIAANRAERSAAFALTYQAYTRVGLCPRNAFEMRVTPYQLLPTSDVFIARLDGEVISTLSLVCDGHLGLPMEVIYPEEIARQRAAGRKLAEVSCLADRRRDPCRYFPVFLELCRMMVQSARYRGVDQLLAAVHPRHARFYRRYMAFTNFGDIREYPSVCNNLAEALCLDFPRIDRERPSTYELFFGEPLPAETIRPRPISWADQEFFAPIASCEGKLPLVKQHAFDSISIDVSTMQPAF
ncbi:MAG: long-chain N-acyl amino acid synthase [Planctomycetota bacterium]|nr:MAG: long-chain N-acyl amino acid synthase [Planctomycetota bacterium]